MPESDSGSLSAIILNLTVRDCQFRFHCGVGKQNFKWLAFSAARLYGQHHTQYCVEQFTPINVIDHEGNSCFPAEIIQERCQSGDELTIELIGPKLNRTDPNIVREQTLWELFAYTPQNEFETVVFIFDANAAGLDLKRPPAIFGNFTAWSNPIPMQPYRPHTSGPGLNNHGQNGGNNAAGSSSSDPTTGLPLPSSQTSSGLYRFQMDFPKNAELVFKFLLDEPDQNEPQTVLGPHYEIVSDGTAQMNYFRVVNDEEEEMTLLNQQFLSRVPVSEGGMAPSRGSMSRVGTAGSVSQALLEDAMNNTMATTVANTLNQAAGSSSAGPGGRLLSGGYPGSIPSYSLPGAAGLSSAAALSFSSGPVTQARFSASSHLRPSSRLQNGRLIAGISYDQRRYFVPSNARPGSREANTRFGAGAFMKEKMVEMWSKSRGGARDGISGLGHSSGGVGPGGDNTRMDFSGSNGSSFEPRAHAGGDGNGGYNGSGPNTSRFQFGSGGGSNANSTFSPSLYLGGPGSDSNNTILRGNSNWNSGFAYQKPGQGFEPSSLYGPNSMNPASGSDSYFNHLRSVGPGFKFGRPGPVALGGYMGSIHAGTYQGLNINTNLHGFHLYQLNQQRYLGMSGSGPIVAGAAANTNGRSEGMFNSSALKPQPGPSGAKFQSSYYVGPNGQRILAVRGGSAGSALRARLVNNINDAAFPASRQGNELGGDMGFGDDSNGSIEQPVATDKAGNKIVPQRVTGKFTGVKLMDRSSEQRIFESDWTDIQIADIERDMDKRLELKSVLDRYKTQLRNIFRFYASSSGRDIQYINIIKFLTFCRTCKLLDKRVTVGRLDSLFLRINVNEEFDEIKLKEKNSSSRHLLTLKSDPFNPDNQFIRGEFYESLIRIAVLKFPKLNHVEALETLLKDYVFPNALDQESRQLRASLLEEDVQKVYSQYGERLYSVFLHYASRDKADRMKEHSTTINVKEFNQFLDEFMLIDSRLSRVKALQAFVMSQEEEIVENIRLQKLAAQREAQEEAGIAATNSATQMNQENVFLSTTYEMTYAEFLEVLARLASKRYGEMGELAQQLGELLFFMFPSEEERRARLKARSDAAAAQMAVQAAQEQAAKAAAKAKAEADAKARAESEAAAEAEKAKGKGKKVATPANKSRK